MSTWACFSKWATSGPLGAGFKAYILGVLVAYVAVVLRSRSYGRPMGVDSTVRVLVGSAGLGTGAYSIAHGWTMDDFDLLVLNALLMYGVVAAHIGGMALRTAWLAAGPDPRPNPKRANGNPGETE